MEQSKINNIEILKSILNMSLEPRATAVFSWDQKNGYSVNVDLSPFNDKWEQFVNLISDDEDEQDIRIVYTDEHQVTSDAWISLVDIEHLATDIFHTKHPDTPGMIVEAMRTVNSIIATYKDSESIESINDRIMKYVNDDLNKQINDIVNNSHDAFVAEIVAAIEELVRQLDDDDLDYYDKLALNYQKDYYPAYDPFIDDEDDDEDEDDE